MSKNHSEKT
jgi:hypothetical protein